MPVGYHLAGFLDAFVSDIVASRGVHQILHLGVQQTATHAQFCCDICNREVGVADVAIHKCYQALDEVAVKLGQTIVLLHLCLAVIEDRLLAGLYQFEQIADFST